MKVSEVRCLRGHRYWVQCVAFAPDGSLALSGSGQPPRADDAEADFTARLWDLQTGCEVRRFTGHAGWVTGVAFAPDGRRCVTASYDTTLRIWDLETGRPLSCLCGHSDRGARPRDLP